MRPITIVAGLLFLNILTSACASSEARVPTKSMVFFDGKHSLQRLVQYSETESQLSGGGFFFLGTGVGSISGETKNNYSVKFAWKSNEDGSFIISSIPLEKVRVKFDEKIEVPQVEFKLYCNRDYCGEDWLLRNYGQQRLIDDGYIIYATITVKSSDWPLKIEMPLP